MKIPKLISDHLWGIKTQEPTECICGCHYCGYRNVICGDCYRNNCITSKIFRHNNE